METLTHCQLCSSSSLQILDVEANIMRCGACGYIFDNPRPTPEEIAEYYSQPSKYDGWLDAVDQRQRLWDRRLKKLLRRGAGGSLLDVGTGIGQFLAVARPHFSKVLGTEVSASAARIARKKYGVDVINDDLEQIDFGESRFDTITLFHVLEHVHDPAAVIKKCHSIMREGSILLVAVPNELHSLRQKIRKFLCRFGLLKSTFHGQLGIAPIQLDGSLDEIHLSHFTPQVLEGLMERAGFTVLENGMDPYFVAKGFAEMANMAYFKLMSLFWRLTGKNCYDTIWLVAKRKSVQTVSP